jgi:hypothetical protein
MALSADRGVHRAHDGEIVELLFGLLVRLDDRLSGKDVQPWSPA